MKLSNNEESDAPIDTLFNVDFKIPKVQRKYCHYYLGTPVISNADISITDGHIIISQEQHADNNFFALIILKY